ncbi:hypothetical protein EYZ11_008320 [Aspergillus tanneri]|uniref:Uncharacterized protein n=1 Tax=Aspergillus tanneri TaxID=1220188 RepID=A0A4S3JCY7_9EURO|nr:hypothetical protein EYZ11_008320 [Aspergillus tanneri]
MRHPEWTPKRFRRKDPKKAEADAPENGRPPMGGAAVELPRKTVAHPSVARS